MAYRNLIHLTCTDKKEFFLRLRDFLCAQDATAGTYDYSTTGIGWTMHDEVYAANKDNPAINDYFIIYSPGENGDEDIYIKVIWTSGYIGFRGFQSWDASTHAGSTNNFGGTVSNFTVSDTVSPWELSIYGDLDALFVMNQMRTNNKYAVTCGKFDPSWDNLSDTVANCAGALTAGSDVSITLDAIPSNWAVGKEVFIRTTHNNAMTTVKIEKITIKTLVGLVITADLVNSYTANSKLSDFVGYYTCRTNNYMYQLNILISDGGTLNLYPSANTNSIALASYDPGPYEDKFIMIRMFYGTNGSPKHLRKVPTPVAGWSPGDVIVEDDGTQWRFYYAYSGHYGVVKEV